MGLGEQYRWIIGGDAGVRDSMGRPRVPVVGLEDGSVILGIATLDGDGPVIDPRAWVTLPNEVAVRLGYYLQTAAEENRQREV